MLILQKFGERIVGATTSINVFIFLLMNKYIYIFFLFFCPIIYTTKSGRINFGQSSRMSDFTVYFLKSVDENED